MNTIIDLLNEKNFCLEKFIEVNTLELERFRQGEFSRLEDFYASREGLLEIIKRIDFLIDKKNNSPLDLGFVTNEVRQEIVNAQQKKNKLVQLIMEQDLEILSTLEEAKSNLIRELSLSRSTRKAISSYKSSAPAGRLDEEA